MANKTNHKFGVVYGAPSQLSAEKIVEGKLYFLAGDESNGIKQGIYGVNPLTSDVSNGVFDLALFGTGAIANGTGYGLSQNNFDNNYKIKLDGIEANANNYSHPGIGDADTSKTLNASDGTYISGIKRDSSGHIVDISTSAISSMRVENAVNATNAINASTSDVAKKVTNKFKLNNIEFDGSKEVSIAIEGGNDSIDVSTSDSSIVISVNNNWIEGKLTKVLFYQGTVSSTADVSAKLSEAKTGYVYVANASFSTLASQTGVAYNVESGDYFIFNESKKFDVVNGENQVSNANATLSVGSSTTIATVDGTEITVSLPAKGNSYYEHSSLDKSKTTTAVDTSALSEVVFNTNNKVFTVVNGAYRDASGHVGKVSTTTYTLPDTAFSDTIYEHPSAINGTTLADTSLKSSNATPLSHGDTFTIATGVYRDASGHISKVATETFKLPTDNDTKCTSATLNVDSSADVPTSLYADVVSNTQISLSGTGTTLTGTMTSVRVATQKAVDAAQSAAIEAATIYWETL